MGWEERNGIGERTYYYEKERVNGKVVSRYIPTLIAPLWAQINENARLEREEWRKFKKDQVATDRRIDTAVKHIRTAIRGALFASGFYLHKRQWRKRRMENSTANESQLKPNQLDKFIESSPTFRFHILSIQARGENPPSEIVNQLKTMLIEYPDLWREFGDLAANETASLIGRAWRSDPAGKESVELACKIMRGRLEHDQSSPIEQMAIDEVVLSWLRLYEVQGRHTSAMYNCGGTRHDSAEFWDKRLMHSQRRYLRACESLVRIRKLSRRVPVVQINVAEPGAQQVNLSSRKDYICVSDFELPCP